MLPYVQVKCHSYHKVVSESESELIYLKYHMHKEKHKDQRHKNSQTPLNDH